MENDLNPEKPIKVLIKPKFSFAMLFFYLLIVALGVFIYLNFTQFKTFLGYLRQISPLWLVLALFTQIITYVFVAMIFSYLMKHFGCKNQISRFDLFKSAIVSFTLTNLIPTVGISGQAYLVYFFQKKNLSKNISFLIAVLETLTYFSAHVLFSIYLVFYLFFSNIKLGGILFTVSILGIFGFIFMDILVLSLTSKKIMLFFEKHSKHNRLVGFFWKRLHIVEEQFTHDEWESPFEFIKKQKQNLFRPLLFQILIFIADALTIIFLFRGFNFPINFWTALAGFVLTKIVSMVSFSPGGLVFFEGAMILFFSSFGIAGQLVLIVTLIFRFLSFLLPLPFGLVFYRQLGSNQVSANNYPVNTNN